MENFTSDNAAPPLPDADADYLPEGGDAAAKARWRYLKHLTDMRYKERGVRAYATEEARAKRVKIKAWLANETKEEQRIIKEKIRHTFWPTPLTPQIFDFCLMRSLISLGLGDF